MPSRPDVQTARDGLLVLSEIDYPCWKATVYGRSAPLYRVDYALRGIAVPAGAHHVRCYYDDKAFKLGGILSLVSLCLTLGALGVGIFRRTQKPRLTSTAVKSADHDRTA